MTAKNKKKRNENNFDHFIFFEFYLVLLYDRLLIALNAFPSIRFNSNCIQCATIKTNLWHERLRFSNVVLFAFICLFAYRFSPSSRHTDTFTHAVKKHCENFSSHENGGRIARCPDTCYWENKLFFFFLFFFHRLIFSSRKMLFHELVVRNDRRRKQRKKRGNKTIKKPCRICAHFSFVFVSQNSQFSSHLIISWQCVFSVAFFFVYVHLLVWFLSPQKKKCSSLTNRIVTASWK